MQISGTNLLLASQQAAPAAAPAPGFAAALQKISGFTPRDLTVPEPKAAPEIKPAAAAPIPSRPMRPGMHVDLKV
jgi:hypothetical protein